MRSHSIVITLFACTLLLASGTVAADVYKSTDGGETWSFAGLADTDVTDLLLRPDDADTLVARSGARLFQSTDAGANWQRLDDGSLRAFTISNAGMIGAALPGTVKSILIDRGSPSVMYAIGESTDEPGASGEGTALMRSDDGGVSWTPLYELPLALAHCIEQNADLQRVFVCGSPLRESGRPAEVHVTADGGDNWEHVPCCSTGGDNEAWVIRADPNDSLVMYAGVQGDATPNGDGLLLSVDGGATWEEAHGLERNPPLELRRAAVADIEVDPINTAVAYARTSYGIYKSINGGANWAHAGLRDEPLRKLALDPSHPSTLYVANAPSADTVLWRSTDGAETWTPHGTGLENLDVTAIVVDPRDSAVIHVATTAVAANGDADTDADADAGNEDTDTDTDSGADTDTDTDDTPAPSAPSGETSAPSASGGTAASGGGGAGHGLLSLFAWLPAVFRRRLVYLSEGLRRTITV